MGCLLWIFVRKLTASNNGTALYTILFGRPISVAHVAGPFGPLSWECCPTRGGQGNQPSTHLDHGYPVLTAVIMVMEILTHWIACAFRRSECPPPKSLRSRLGGWCSHDLHLVFAQETPRPIWLKFSLVLPHWVRFLCWEQHNAAEVNLEQN